MKTTKRFLLAITVVSLFFITGCTTMQSIPYDDVYYSTTKGAPQDVSALQNSATVNTTPAQYETGTVEAVNTSGQNISSANPKEEGYTIDTLSTNTIKTNNVDSVVYSKINTGLGFNSSSFGTGVSSWSLGGYAGMFGYNTFAYDPFWYSFNSPYSFYPYYNNWYPYYGYGGGWSLYSFSLGYPYWGFGFGYPYNGYSPYYGYGGYPYYGFGGYPYYGYQPYLNRDYKYGHRSSAMGGSYIPSGGGAIPLVGTKSTRAEVGKPSGIRPSAISENGTTKAVTRPVGSMRYQKALENAKSSRVETNGNMLQKPPIYRGNNATERAPQYQRPAYRQPVNMSVPRYQKPKQYQSLDTRQPRSSNEYFRPQPQTIINGKATRVNTFRGSQRFNVYRPAQTRSYNYNRPRPVYRNSWVRTSRSTPTREYAPSQRFYSSPTYNNNNNVNRTYSPPVRISTGSGNNGSGGGTRGGGGGGGNIRR